jgi:hypothetical protein
MAQQTQLLSTLVDGANHRQGGQQNDFQRKLEGFLKLRPPTYDGTDPDLLVADDWLKEMEKKLDLTTFTDDECVRATTHQLIGAASACWTVLVTPMRTLPTSHGMSSQKPSLNTIFPWVSWRPRLRSSATSRWEKIG